MPSWEHVERIHDFYQRVERRELIARSAFFRASSR
jgi:hypothetical protein